MLFKVRSKCTGEVYTVYAVKQHKNACDCEFLVFEKSGGYWRWIVAEVCEPVEQ